MAQVDFTHLDLEDCNNIYVPMDINKNTLFSIIDIDRPINISITDKSKTLRHPSSRSNKQIENHEQIRNLRSRNSNVLVGTTKRYGLFFINFMNLNYFKKSSQSIMFSYFNYVLP